MPRLTRILALLATIAVADAFLTSAPVGLQAASKKASLPRSDHRRRDFSPRMAKTFGTTDFKVNWMQPNAQGSFGKVFFASQGFAGMGGQVDLGVCSMLALMAAAGRHKVPCQPEVCNVDVRD